MSIFQAFEVDVFEDPRFCDEYSHLWKRMFLGFCKTQLNPHCNQIDVLAIFNVVLDAHTYYIALIDSLCQFFKRLK